MIVFDAAGLLCVVVVVVMGAFFNYVRARTSTLFCTLVVRTYESSYERAAAVLTSSPSVHTNTQQRHTQQHAQQATLKKFVAPWFVSLACCSRISFRKSIRTLLFIIEYLITPYPGVVGTVGGIWEVRTK